MKFTRMTIEKKLKTGFLTVALIALVLGMLGFWGLSRLESTLENIGNNRIPDLQALSILNTERMAIRAQTLDIYTAENSEHDVAVASYRQIQQERAESWEAVEQAWSTLQGIPRATDHGRQLVSDLGKEYRAWRSHYVELDGLIDRFVNSTGDDQRAALYLQYGDAVERMIPVSDRMGALFVRLTENNTTNTNAVMEDSMGMARFLEWTMLIAAIGGVIIAIVMGIVLSRSISGPLSRGVGIADKISRQNLSEDVPSDLLERSDEIGDLARSMQTMTENLRDVINDIFSGVQTLASSATELSAVSSQTSQNVTSMSELTTTVAAAAEESSTNTTSVAASMEQAATNLTSVAGATEEMSATIGEIASNSEKARRISADAGDKATSVSTLMQELGLAAQEIGMVTETITDISSQTNLLALNATIEAARAGTAGKGFAVVANEIKELAKQTADATEDIKNKIGGVQQTAGSAIADIEKITGVVGEVSHIISSIATAIEEQSSVTRDVAGNISQASAGVNDANERVAQTASVSQSMAQDISRVDQSVSEIRAGGEQVQNSAVELSKLAEQLKHMLEKFDLDESVEKSSPSVAKLITNNVNETPALSIP